MPAQLVQRRICRRPRQGYAGEVSGCRYWGRLRKVRKLARSVGQICRTRELRRMSGIYLRCRTKQARGRDDMRVMERLRRGICTALTLCGWLAAVNFLLA